MSGDLFPTPHRLALLRDVDAGEIWQSSNHESWDALMFKRTTRVTEAERAGWIELGEGVAGKVGTPFAGASARRWRLTDAGRAVLDAHPERPS